LAGMRFVDTAKYHDSMLLLLCLSCLHTFNDSNLLNSLLIGGKGDDVTVTLTKTYLPLSDI
jgi:hypothetical protein